MPRVTQVGGHSCVLFQSVYGRILSRQRCRGTLVFWRRASLTGSDVQIGQFKKPFPTVVYVFEALCKSLKFL